MDIHYSVGFGCAAEWLEFIELAEGPQQASTVFLAGCCPVLAAADFGIALQRLQGGKLTVC